MGEFGYKEKVFEWPESYVVLADDPGIKYFTDLQKLYAVLISKTCFTAKDVSKKFSSVGVRWLGFLCVLLHVSLTSEYCIDCLVNLDESKIPNKPAKKLIENTITMLKVLENDSSMRKDIFVFAREYFQAWRMVVMSDGRNLISTAINTTRRMAAVGREIKLGTTYFETLNRHLYNLFLPLSTDIDQVADNSRIFGRRLRVYTSSIQGSSQIQVYAATA